MGDEAFAEEGGGAAPRAVDELVRHHHMEGLDILAQAPHRADADNELDAERLERVDVRARGQLRGQNAMTDAVPGQEGDGHAVH